MARAFPQTLPQEFDRDPGGQDWQNLRGELVALLDQVESRVARSGQDTGAYSISERMQALQAQLNADEPPNRHREALRSVQRAVDRFSDHGDEGFMPQSGNPRDSLQAAISQIRSRQGDMPVARAPAPSGAAAPARIDQLTQALDGMTGRLERIEGEIKTQLKTGGDVRGVADQVAQLAHVVELLAGAVGETGQVKRLEGQIASLAKLIAQGREVDLSALTQRLDEVSATVGRLADLQLQFAGRAESPALVQRLDDVSATVGRLADLQVQYANRVESPVQSAAFREGMQAIEASVRNVYDRIDTLERSASISPSDVDHLSAEMARFAEVVKAGTTPPQNLIELIDALNTRISDMESGDRLLAGLRKDLAGLRDSVLVALEPRFNALERKIEYLGSKNDLSTLTAQIESIGARIAEQPIDPGIGHIEAQVRQLVARMDQTGEQLSGLAKLYAAGTEAPDFEALAERVASRTMAMTPGAPANGLTQSSLDALEARVTGLLQGMVQDPVSPDLGDVRDGIGEVNLRLARLENALMERHSSPAVHAPAADAAPDAQIADLIEAPAARNPERAPAFVPTPVQIEPVRTRGDTMPKSPVEEAPLNAPPFADPTPPRNRHPGLEEDMALAGRYVETAAPPKLPSAGFDPGPTPPAPTPHLGIFEPVAAPAPGTPPAIGPASTNTFIQAARRAAQRQTPARIEANPNSLIGRALSRLQTGTTPAAPEEAPRVLAGDKPARKKWMPERVEPAVPEPSMSVPEAEPTMQADALAPEGEVKRSFLARHRSIILLAAVLVVMCLLAINLVLQRVGGKGASAPPAATTEQTGDIGDEALPPAGNISADNLAPRVIPMADSLATGSIDSSAAQGFAETPTQTMPSAFAAAEALADSGTAALSVPADTLLSPVKVELPPEGVGPIELRQAAASGDARAQFEVAAIYTEGRAVPQDYKAAAIWYERAAAQGFAPAEYRLGSLYENGEGLDKDLTSAKLWYERAAEAGNRMSMHNLAALYAGGQLGGQQFDAAAKWFEEAADRGMTDSQFNLGMLYARGLGVAQSLEVSYKWFGIAALTGDKDAIKARDDIARSLDAEAVGRLTAEVAAWKPQAIDLAANFAPIGTWAKAFDPGETIGSKDIVASVQRALGRLGFDVGAPDGVAGPKTADAIKAFEQATGMNAIGLINPRLLAVLGSQPV